MMSASDLKLISVGFEGIGSGFFYKFNIDGKCLYTIITCAHVAEKCTKNDSIVFFKKDNFKINNISLPFNDDVCRSILFLDDYNEFENVNNDENDLAVIILTNDFVDKYKLTDNFILSNTNTVIDKSHINNFCSTKMIGWKYRKITSYICDSQSVVGSNIVVDGTLATMTGDDDLLYCNMQSLEGLSGSPVFVVKKDFSNINHQNDNPFESFVNIDLVDMLFLGVNIGRVVEKNKVIFKNSENKESNKYEALNKTNLSIIINMEKIKDFEEFLTLYL